MSKIEKDFLAQLLTKSNDVTIIHKEYSIFPDDYCTYIVTFKVKKEEE